MIKSALPYFRQELMKIAKLPSLHIPSARTQILSPGLKAAKSPVGSMSPIVNKTSRAGHAPGIV
jgi:hypothetical protein